MNDIIAHLKENILFAGINDIDFLKVGAKEFGFVNFKPGIDIIKQGQEADKIYFIVSGSVSIKRKISLGKDIELAIKGTNDFFGEIAVIIKNKRSATVSSITAVQLIYISKKGFLQLLKLYQKLTANLLKQISYMVYNLDPRIVYEVIKTNNIKPLSYKIGQQQDELRKLNTKLLAEIEQKNIIEKELVEANQELLVVQKELKFAALTDYLTSIKNRRAMMEFIKTEENRQQRSKKPFCFILCDIDNFKQINDVYGHNCGDFILKETAKIMKKKIRKTDGIARWGGDEFLFLLSETNLKGAEIITKKILKTICEHDYVYCGKRVKVTITLGVSEKKINNNYQDIINKADEAMYKGKSLGKNRTELYVD